MQLPALTVKAPELLTVPPGVVTAIFPVIAPMGTVAVSCVSEFTVKVVAATPPKVTLVVCLRLTPVIVTTVPTGLLVGLKLVICGITRKITLLVNVPLGVTTVTLPVVASVGTVVVISELDTTLNVASVPLKLTLVVPVRSVARIMTVAPTLVYFEECAIAISSAICGCPVEVPIGNPERETYTRGDHRWCHRN